MAEPHVVLNAMSEAGARAALARCCGARRWVAGMMQQVPFATRSALHEAADRVWRSLTREDYLEAFAHHPAIGEDLAQLRARHAGTASWSSQEQAGVQAADEQTLLSLREGNQRYRERFGYVFLICATGKSAAEMLAALRERLPNGPERELAIAAEEHEKITHIRLAKLGEETA